MSSVRGFVPPVPPPSLGLAPMPQTTSDWLANQWVCHSMREYRTGYSERPSGASSFIISPRRMALNTRFPGHGQTLKHLLKYS
jgi:hypothetical protein